MRKKILISISKARSMYQKGVGYLVGYPVGYPVGYLAIYPRPSTKTASWTCLLYTSDAADDLLCVDLGGRRIIKKSKTQKLDTTF